LNPGPGREAEILMLRQTVPDLHSRKIRGDRREGNASPLTPYPLRVNSSVLIVGSYNA
jgi:hypothetical protein